MQRRTNIQISSAIIMLSILTIMIQFAAYYCFEAPFIIWGISCLISVTCCHILLEQSTTYEACFNFSLLTLFISLVIIVICSYGNVKTFLPYSGVMLGIAVINWLIPMLHCFLRYMLDYGTRIEGFNEFYRNISIIFLLFYFAILIYGMFWKEAFPWAYPIETVPRNILPFNLIATLIEDYLYGYATLKEILAYLLSHIVLFIPYGFFTGLLLRRQKRLPRFLSLLVLPFLIEVLQYIFIPELCDIDDLIYAFIGGMIGSLSFTLMNVIFRAISGKDFLAREADYRYLGTPLHF